MRFDVNEVDEGSRAQARSSGSADQADVFGANIIHHEVARNDAQRM